MQAHCLQTAGNVPGFWSDTIMNRHFCVEKSMIQAMFLESVLFVELQGQVPQSEV